MFRRLGWMRWRWNPWGNGPKWEGVGAGSHATPGVFVRVASKGLRETGVCKSGKQRTYTVPFLRVRAKERRKEGRASLSPSYHSIYYHIANSLVKTEMVGRERKADAVRQLVEPHQAEVVPKLADHCAMRRSKPVTAARPTAVRMAPARRRKMVAYQEGDRWKASGPLPR